MRRWAGDINARGSVHTEVSGEVRGEGGGRSVRLCAHKSLHVYIYTETKRPSHLISILIQTLYSLPSDSSPL